VPKNSIIIRKKVDINATINNIKDLIDLIEKYPLNDEVEYNINMTALHKIKTELNELNNMIGMKDMKENVVDQLLYYIQDLHSTSSNGDFMHTVIYGPSGTGKTEIAKIIGRIFCNLGILKKGVFKKVTRSDLVAGYLGQTAMKTKDVIQECLGGVLFIDEAYALGNVEKRDSFSKECIDTLCEALSDYKDNLMVIIAGYESELKDCFFSYNQGLDSRFTWRFKTENYKSEDLFQIFLKKVKDAGWTVEENTKINAEWFEKNMVYFKFFGRDIETLFSKIKIAHGRRIFCKPETDRKKITFSDLEKGFEMFLKNDDVKNRKESETMNKMLMSIYV
jgi:SpoVK/Ycf46/Vps4 family AAA+-type ATPase